MMRLTCLLALLLFAASLAAQQPAAVDDTSATASTPLDELLLAYTPADAVAVLRCQGGRDVASPLQLAGLFLEGLGAGVRLLALADPERPWAVVLSRRPARFGPPRPRPVLWLLPAPGGGAGDSGAVERLFERMASDADVRVVGSYVLVAPAGESVRPGGSALADDALEGDASCSLDVATLLEPARPFLLGMLEAQERLERSRARGLGRADTEAPWAHGLVLRALLDRSERVDVDVVFADGWLDIAVTLALASGDDDLLAPPPLAADLHALAAHLPDDAGALAVGRGAGEVVAGVPWLLTPSRLADQGAGLAPEEHAALSAWWQHEQRRARELDGGWAVALDPTAQGLATLVVNGAAGGPDEARAQARHVGELLTAPELASLGVHAETLGPRTIGERELHEARLTLDADGWARAALTTPWGEVPDASSRAFGDSLLGDGPRRLGWLAHDDRVLVASGDDGSWLPAAAARSTVPPSLERALALQPGEPRFALAYDLRTWLGWASRLGDVWMPDWEPLREDALAGAADGPPILLLASLVSEGPTHRLALALDREALTALQDDIVEAQVRARQDR